MFTIQDVEKIAKLSHLELTEDEKVTFTQQFSTILDYFEILNTAQIPQITPDRDESRLSIFREDRIEPSTVVPQQFSSYLEENCFKVPKIIDAG